MKTIKTIGLKISREVKTAILVLLGITLFIFGFNYLKGNNLLEDSKILYVTYDNVSGVNNSTAVKVNGVPIGKVADVELAEDNSGKVIVTLNLNTNFKFSKNSVALLQDDGLIGGKNITIIPANDNAAEAESGDMLKSKVKSSLTQVFGETLSPLQTKLERVLISVDTLLTGFNTIFDAKTQKDLKNSIASLDATVTSFESTSKALNSVIKGNQSKLNNTLTNFNTMSNDLSKVTTSLSKSNIGNTVNELEGTLDRLNSVMASVQKGNGSMGKLLKDEKLYNNLEGASKQLEQLLQDMKINPKRYVHFSLFGKKPKRYDEQGNEIKETN